MTDRGVGDPDWAACDRTCDGITALLDAAGCDRCGHEMTGNEFWLTARAERAEAQAARCSFTATDQYGMVHRCTHRAGHDGACTIDTTEPVAWAAMDSNGEVMETAHADPDNFREWWREQSEIDATAYAVIPLYATPQESAEVPEMMRRIARWCDDHVREIPVQVKTRAPGELASLLHHLAEFVESGEPFTEDAVTDTDESAEVERWKARGVRVANRATRLEAEVGRLRSALEDIEAVTAAPDAFYGTDMRVVDAWHIARSALNTETDG